MLARASRRVFSKSSVRAMSTYKLPDLKYDYSALEPTVSAQIMELHHSKHHQTYVNNLNAALESYAAAEAKNDVAKMIALQSAINFNGGGHVNHTLFWENLAPAGGEGPSGDLAAAIDAKWGSLDAFIKEFNAKTAAVQGSGWGWLGYNAATGSLEIATKSNQDPLTELTPLLGVDVWEHAYYLDYLNARPKYLENIWKVINWSDVAAKYEAAK
uniref:Superoxide dismutase n=1 Tax=Lotharella globosa TaxID=91324 RepID=A0A6V3KM33_9EUKA|mmetsp:Transcript_6195/g.11700  ORF Transcript_6195/g.11700 Transcript_6195/m.11700 type:complete len:214 (+) Transcript_6195:74-715(+)